MKRLKSYIIMGVAAVLATSCSDFLNTAPYDALSPGTTWKTEEDAQKFVVGCYGGDNDQVPGWEDGSTLLYLDCASDFSYNNFPWEGYTPLGNGTLTASNYGTSFYDFSVIRRCNTFMDNIEAIPFNDPAVKKDLIAQVRVIRAYRYFIMNWYYGGVPIISNYSTADEAKVPRNTEAEVRAFVEKELDESTPDLNKAPSARGRIAQGTALAIRMREALYYGDWATAKDRAQKIINLGQYDLEPNYTNLFNVNGQDSKEVIAAVQYIPNVKPLGTIGQLYNNGDGGWSSIVPTQKLIDTYEMKNGLTKEEAGSGYDATHPYANRDPRLAFSVLYPGCNYTKDDGSIAIFNTLDKTINGSTNPNYMTAADNSSKTGLTWAKYLEPMNQYTDIWASNACPIMFRYAEVLLTYAEAENELTGPSAAVYQKINLVRNRVNMPNVDQTKYGTKETLRELIRRERGVEFAGEGLRRADLVRWKTTDGKLLAEKVMTGTLERVMGTVNMDKNVDPTLRATINVNASAEDKKVEDRVFKPHFRYLPIPQSDRDKNPKLEQNTGY
ncbi:RagB/SusD family nutrient uptake outer membrane protein [Bacteroides sp.]|uniref:RagB/SusD family nutrient uptake outer membrane protein n=1 Tax=Bacteroides sp. TaxID=29523 RepID=UPI002FC821F1|nr:RagB/SusD family nutrient uptake outer membrane protein [Bacteroides sp.]